MGSKGYFYSKNGEIHEYAAHKISLKELKKYKNASKILKEYEKLGKNGGIYSILLRENNLIHIIYFSGDSKGLSYTFNNLLFINGSKSYKKFLV